MIVSRSCFLLAVVGVAGCATYASGDRVSEAPGATEGERLYATVQARTTPAATDTSASAQCGRDEERYMGIEKDALTPLRQAWAAKQAGTSVPVTGFTGTLAPAASTVEGVETRPWSVAKGDVS